jgi:hypothetical protein
MISGYFVFDGTSKHRLQERDRKPTWWAQQ